MFNKSENTIAVTGLTKAISQVLKLFIKIIQTFYGNK